MKKFLLLLAGFVLLVGCVSNSDLQNLSNGIATRFESDRWKYGTFYISEWVNTEDGIMHGYKLRINTTEEMQTFLDLVAADKMGPISGPWR